MGMESGMGANNHSVEPTGASRLAYSETVRLREQPPAAHAHVRLPGC